MAEHELMEKLVSLAKRRGFVYQGSEIYGGLAGTWDYGPLGVALKNNIKNIWWRMFIDGRDDMYGLDAAILMHPKVWESSGHVSGFSDPLVECANCHARQRADQIPGFSASDYRVVQKEIWIQFEEPAKKIIAEINRAHSAVEEKHSRVRNLHELVEKESLSVEEKKALLDISGKILEETTRQIEESKNQIEILIAIRKLLEDSTRYSGYVMQQYLNRFLPCPVCKSKEKWGMPSKFNMMFQTQIGATEGSISYLRPETASGIFVNFKNVVDSFHPKLPFGIGQIGKAFRNEIAPRDFIFRVRELEQMEVEYFVRPSEWEQSFEEWRQSVHAFNKAVGIPQDKVYELEVAPEDRAHYSKRTIDFEFDFPFGRKELYGLAYRTDFDLNAHQTGSGKDLSYRPEGEEPFVPHVIEPSFGVDRTFLAVLASAYTEDEQNGEVRAYLKLKPSVAPIKAAVFPLLKNKPELVAKAREVYDALKKEIPQVAWDDNGNVGKRYRRQDEVGTPWCVTIDFDTLGETPEMKDTVTVRDRDTGEQERVAIADLVARLKAQL